MKYLSEKQTSELITHELAYNAVTDAFIAISQTAKVFPVVIAEGSQNNSIFSVKSAHAENLSGWKVGSYWPQNSEKGIPCHGTTIFLLNEDSGCLDAVIEASLVNAYRTAAADAIAADLLTRKDAETLTIFGTGHQAFYECIAISKVRALTKINVVGRNIIKAQNLVQRLKDYGLTAQIEEAKEACEEADIIVTATTATSPLFEHSWVSEGTHISAMGADSKGKQELPIELYPNAKLFCDYKAQAITIGEFQHVDDFYKANIHMIGDVLTKKISGRLSKEEITIFDSSGIAVQDLFIGKYLLELLT